MREDSKTRTELLQEIEELRSLISRLESTPMEEIDGIFQSSDVSAEHILRSHSFRELAEAPRPLRLGYESTESIELPSLFGRDVTDEDTKAEIWSTTFGKVIQALPIPAFLIDEDFNVLASNQACGRFTPEYGKIRGKPFTALFVGPGSATRAKSILNQIFSDREPRMGEGTLKIEDAMIWARMTFRSIRIVTERFVLVLIEDLTSEKIQLHENEMLRKELEKRVEKRTAQLQSANEELKREITERKRMEQERENMIVKLQEALAHIKKLSGLLPMCSSCKKIRDDKGYWQQIEAYIRDHSEAEFSHSLCPECAKKLYPELFD